MNSLLFRPFGNFGDLEEDFYNAENVNTTENHQAWDAISNLITNTLTNVAQPVINGLVNASVYGDPAYYLTTKDGKQAPVYKRSDGRFFTLDATGQAVLLPATPAAPPAGIATATSAQWMAVAAVGAAALLLIVLVMKKR